MASGKNKNYNRGANYERKIARQLRETGCYVMRSAGSHGAADLISINPSTNQISLIQCKAYKVSQNKKETILEELKALEGHYNVKAVLV